MTFLIGVSVSKCTLLCKDGRTYNLSNSIEVDTDNHMLVCYSQQKIISGGLLILSHHRSMDGIQEIVTYGVILDSFKELTEFAHRNVFKYKELGRVFDAAVYTHHSFDSVEEAKEFVEKYGS